MTTKLELQVWQRVAGLAQSPSHDYHHIARVQGYVDALGEALKIDTGLIRIAAILHDLGRGDQNRRHGLASVQASKEMAEEVLRHLPLTENDRRVVVEAIENHDQPDVHSDAHASRILKDADFLAGFGAWGVLRIAMWSGETGRRIDDVLGRIAGGMRRRLDSLEYPESREAAFREYLFAQQFRSELNRPVRLSAPNHSGFYCVIEGISGVGKNTIAKALNEKLKTLNIPCILVEEPGESYRILRQNLPPKANKDFEPLKKALLMADRADQFTRTVIPSLQKGKVVIGVRSYLSTAVYQTSDHAEAYRTMLEHDWVPSCDLLLLLQADVDTALNRISKRNKRAGEYETPDKMKAHKAKYEDLVSSFPSHCTEILDASKETVEVVKDAFMILEAQLQKKRIV
jgi:dTMP kinase